MKRTILFTIMLSLCTTLFSQEKYLAGQSRVCILFDFSLATIMEMAYPVWANDSVCVNSIRRWQRAVISDFNRRSAIQSSYDLRNRGEKYDVLCTVLQVDHDGETRGYVSLVEHSTNRTLASERIKVGGGKWNTFEILWFEKSKVLARRIRKFVEKYSPYK